MDVEQLGGAMTEKLAELFDDGGARGSVKTQPQKLILKTLKLDYLKYCQNVYLSSCKMNIYTNSN